MRWQTITSYAAAEKAFNHRRGRKNWKRLSGYLRLQKDGDEFTVTNKGGSTPLATITPDNILTVHFNNMVQNMGRFSVPYHLWTYFHMHIFHRTDRRSSQHWWYRYRDTNYPVTDGFRIDMDTRLPVSPLVEVQRRRVRRDVAKPIREKIADWQRLATSYLALETNFTKGMLAGYDPKLPQLEDEVTMKGLLEMMRWGAERGYGQLLYIDNHWSGRWSSPDHLQDRAKRAFQTAFEKWKEELYVEHGCFTWVKLDKAA